MFWPFNRSKPAPPPPAPNPPARRQMTPQIADVQEFAADTVLARKTLAGGTGQATVVRNPDAIADAYRHSAPLHAIVRDISRDAAALPLIFTTADGNKELDEQHPIVQLVRNPQPGSTALWRDLIADYLLFGACFAEASMQDATAAATTLAAQRQPITDMWRIAPRFVQLELTTQSMLPRKIALTDGNASWEVERNGRCGVFFLFDYDPTNIKTRRVASAGDAARIAGDCYAVMQDYAKQQAKNRYIPHGMFRPANGAMLNAEQTDNLFERLRLAWRIARQHQTPMVSSDGLEYQAFQHSAQEADFVNSKFSAARDICMLYGYPPAKLGIPETAAFRNLSESRQAYYLNAVLPPAMEFWRRFVQWARLHYPAPADFNIAIDVNAIPALSERRASMMTQLTGVDFLTTNEKREIAGLEPVKDAAADEVLVGGGKMPLSDAAAPIDGDETDPEPEHPDDPADDDAEHD